MPYLRPAIGAKSTYGGVPVTNPVQKRVREVQIKPWEHYHEPAELKKCCTIEGRLFLEIVGVHCALPDISNDKRCTGEPGCCLAPLKGALHKLS